MKPRTFVTGVAAVCATALLTAGLLAQQKPGDEKKPAQSGKTADKTAEHPMSPQQQAMMDAMTKYAAPGEPHKALAKKEGKWQIQGKFWFSPDSEAGEFTGTSTFKMILDGHYLLENVEGNEPEENGQIFKGMGIIGYDNFGKNYIVVWIDNMGTSVSRFTGTPSADWQTITYTGEEPDFITGKYKTVKSIERKISDDQYVSTMYDKTADGKEYKHMEITYTRPSTTPQTKPAPSSSPQQPQSPPKKP